MTALPTTHTIVKSNLSFKGSYTIIDIKNTAGLIRELLIVSPVPFTIQLIVDDIYLLRDASFNSLSTMSSYISSVYNSDIAAFMSGAFYVISIINIGFLSNLKAIVEVDYNIYRDQTIVLPDVFCLYDTYKEVLFSTPIFRR